MRSSMFIFIGAIGSNSDATIEELRARLEHAFPECPQQPQFRLNEGLLTLTFTKPDFRFHLAFERQWSENLKDWIKLAEDAELPWDVKPVDLKRLIAIQDRLRHRGWSEFVTYQEIGRRIIQKMERLQNVTTFCIPSVKLKFWNKLLSIIRPRK